MCFVKREAGETGQRKARAKQGYSVESEFTFTAKKRYPNDMMRLMRGQ